jgi:hypothetical protein
MNDKVLTMALMLFMIMIGINAFLYMGSTNLYNENGEPLNIYYGMDEGAFGSQVQTNAEDIEINTDVEMSSTTPSTTQGFTPATVSDNPVGAVYGNELAKLGIGVQLVMLKLGSMFPVISPILNAITFLAFAIQGFAIAYLFSILVRGIFGRLT